MLSVDIKILPGFSTNKEEGDPDAACMTRLTPIKHLK